MAAVHVWLPNHAIVFITFHRSYHLKIGSYNLSNLNIRSYITQNEKFIFELNRNIPVHAVYEFLIYNG